MKKVLIIGYFWPYVGGSKRIWALAKSLPQFGWQPIILTGPLKQPPDPKFRVIATRYRCFLNFGARFFGLNQNIDLSDQLQARVSQAPALLKKILRKSFNLIKAVAAFPDEHRGWLPFAIRAAGQLYQKEKFDALISVYPVTSHLIAKKLQEKYQLPWLADLADLWSDNEAYSFGPLRKIIDRWLEIKILAPAEILTTSSPIYQAELQKWHRNKKVCFIPLGFDSEIFNQPARPLTKKFTVTYTGIFYPKKREPDNFLKALSQLRDQNIIEPDDIEVRFYAPPSDSVSQLIEKYRLKPMVKQCGLVNFQKCLKKQKESQVLLQLNWQDHKGGRAFSGKIFDYLASRRPILAAGGYDHDIIRELITSTQTGVFCPKVNDIKKALCQYYLEYKKEGCVAWRGLEQKIKNYSSQESAKQYAQILNQLT